MRNLTRQIQLVDSAYCDSIYRGDQKILDSRLPTTLRAWREFYEQKYPDVFDLWCMDVSPETSAFEAVVLVLNETSGFEGHFPNFPILPGVLQIGWCIDASRQMFKLPPQVSCERLQNIKFNSPIRPHFVLQVHIELTNSRIKFIVRHTQGVCSSGTLWLTGLNEVT